MRKALSLRRIAPLALTALLVGASACNDDTATVLQPLSRTYNFLLLKEGANGPRGTGGAIARAAAGTSTISDITLAGLEKLEGTAGYVLWSANVVASTGNDSVLTNIARLRSSDFIAIEVDTTISAQGDFVPDVDTLQRQNAVGVVPTFNFGGPGVFYVIRTSAAALGFQPASRNVIFVTLVPDTATAAITTPNVDGSDARLWLRCVVSGAPTTCNQTATGTSTAQWVFGNYNPAIAKQYVFVASGRGRGSLVPDSDVLIINDSLLARPPKGYYYETFLIKRGDDTTFYALDTISIGPQTAPPPRRNVSLYSADSLIVDPVVQAPAGLPQLQLIFAAANRVDGDTIPRLSTTGNAFRRIANINISLEAKLGTPRMSPFVILNGIAPPPIRLRD